MHTFKLISCNIRGDYVKLRYYIIIWIDSDTAIYANASETTCSLYKSYNMMMMSRQCLFSRSEIQNLLHRVDYVALSEF